MRAADACLYHAILHVRRNIESPGSDKWISTDAREMYALVLIAMVQEEHWPHHAKPPSLNEVVSAWTRFHKASDHKAVLLCELIKKHGSLEAAQLAELRWLRRDKSVEVVTEAQRAAARARR